jgi:hypothetical protein
MNQSESRSASHKIKKLHSVYRVDLVPDWGRTGRGRAAWNPGTWSMAEVDRLHNAIVLLADAMGGPSNFIQNLDGVTIQKKEMGHYGGLANAHHVSLSSKGAFSAWTVIHELAHAWDANYGWRLSLALEKATGGFTSPFASFFKKLFGKHDSGLRKADYTPGRHGRLPGCNKAGYFYGDQPSGSNWNFNRKEDFAESVAMYIGWGKANELSPWAEARIGRYLLKNGTKHKSFGTDNWADYAKYFYPLGGDYTLTKRWRFVDDLVKGRIEISK